MPHSYRCHVRWSDVDAYGHVNNVKYFEYFQEARIAFLRDLGGWSDHADRETVVVARLTVDYRRPIVFRPEPYRIDSWLIRVGTSSYDLCSQVRDGESVLARAVTVMVAYDLRASSARQLSPPERAALHAELADAALSSEERC